MASGGALLQTGEKHVISSTTTIPLHDLCENCTIFCGNLQALDWFDEPADSEHQPWQYCSFLCAVAHLSTAQHHCHFCKLLLASLDRWPFAKLEDVLDMNVYLHPREKGGEALVVHALFSKDLPVDRDSGRHFASFALESFEVSQRGGFNEHFAARDIPLYARDNLTRAKDWIETCLAEHTACHSFQENTVGPPQRPTRVLEITEPGTLRLRTDMPDAQYPYLALSYRWSADPEAQIRLLQDNITDFETNVPWDKLTDVYREAIHITVVLGHRYIWIDSLCIIQDSLADWTYESQRMAIVYGNCIANIAFLFPSTRDIPLRDDPRRWNPCILRDATPERRGVYIRHLSDMWRQAFPYESGQEWLVQRNWPLFSRAWTFQEYLLSPRTLLYGERNLMFQCSRHFYDELLGPIAQPSPNLSKGRDWDKRRYFPDILATITGPNGEDVDLESAETLRFGLDWMDLVNEYLHRTLTYPSDRTIAFAGIASSYTRLSGLTYLAGLWYELLPLSLLWFVDKKPPALVRGQYPQIVPRAVDPVYSDDTEEDGVKDSPSWSWFHVPVWKFWRVSCAFNGDEGSIKARSLREPHRSNYQNIFWAKRVAYQSREQGENTYPEDGYAQFSGLKVSIEVLIWPVWIDLPTELAMQFRYIQSIDTLDEDLYWDPDFTYYPDKPSSLSRSPPRRGIFALLNEFQIVRTGGDYHIQRRMAGLVLLPAAEENTWQRVGLWRLKIKIKGITVVEGGVADVAKRWSAYGLTDNWQKEALTLV